MIKKTLNKIKDSLEIFAKGKTELVKEILSNKVMAAIISNLNLNLDDDETTLNVLHK